MTWLITAVVITGGLQAKGQIDTAKAQQIQLDEQADQEKFAAESQSLKRQQELRRVLSANTVGMATSGISGEGTPASIALSNAKQASTTEGTEALSSRLKQAQLKRQGKNIRSAGNIQAASTLLTSSIKASELG